MGFELDLAVRGDYQATTDARLTAIRQGLRDGSDQSADLTKTRLRKDAMAAGFPRRFATTFRGDVFPKRGLSDGPAVLVYSKAPHIASGHADGAKLAPVYSRFLPIPISDGPADGLRRRNGETLIEAFWRRFGNDSLRLARQPNGRFLMVAKLRRTEAGRLTRTRALKPLKRRQGPRINKGSFVSVPVFTLVKNAQLDRRLSSRKILAQAERRHPSRLAYGVRTRLAQSLDDTGRAIR